MSSQAVRMLQNRYRIVAPLGRGGMGAVYQAWDTRLNVPVALKEMHRQPGIGTGKLLRLRRQFRQEATILARLHHPNLVRVTDFFQEAGTDYLVMDFVQGESLASRITREGPLPEREVLIWAHQLLGALAYCHGRSIIHRDVKPQNVIIGNDGQAVLVDFGLVKLWDPRDPRTRTVMHQMGTPTYAPPEQYDPTAGHTDPRSDIYSLGATLYHALSSQPPPTATQRIASRAALKSLRTLNRSVSLATEAVVFRSMELALQDRFATTQEMIAALRASIRPRGRSPVLAQPRSAKAGERRKQPGRIQWKSVSACVWALAGLAVLLLCTAAALVGASLRQAQLASREQAQITETARIEATATAQMLATTEAQDAGATATAQLVQATAASRAQATAITEARASEMLLSALDWPVVLRDSFSSDVSGWKTGEHEGERVIGGRAIVGGKYRWEAEALDEFHWLFSPSHGSVYDFYLTVEARQLSGSGKGEVGLVFRVDDPENFGSFRVRNDGRFAFAVLYRDEWTGVIDWTKSAAIHTDRANQLTVIAEGSSYILIINDELVGQADDDRLGSGTVGLAVGLSDRGESGVFDFDNFELRAP